MEAVDADLGVAVGAVVRYKYCDPILHFFHMLNFKKQTAYFLLLALSTTVILPACRTKEPAAPKESYDGIELTYYKMFDDSDVLEPIITEYEANHPGLTINYRQFTDFEEYQRLILNEMAEGEGPDIFSMPNTWFASNIKKITPISPEAATPAAFDSVFVDVASNDLVRVGPDGQKHIYGLPMTVDTLALYYNRNQYQDRIPSRGKPADTWEGIKEDVALLNKEDNSLGRFEVAGLAMGRGDNISRAVDTLYLLFLQYGVNFYNDNLSAATFASATGGFGQYPAKDALELFVSFADEDQKNYSWNQFMADPDSEEKDVEAFAKGDVSMIVGYGYLYDELKNEINVLKADGDATIDPAVIKVAPIPQLVDPDVSKQKRVAYANYFAETVSRNSEQPNLAWDFLLEVTKKENLAYYFDKTHKPTSRRDLIEEQSADPVYGVFASQVGFAESFPVIDYYAFKRIFSELIAEANDSVSSVNLVKYQDQVTAMLPAEGLIYPEIELKPEEDAK